MNMFDEARALSAMMQMMKCTQIELAKKLGTTQSHVSNKLRLLKLDERVQAEILSANLTERHARALLRLASSEEQLVAIRKIRERKLKVAESEALIDFIHDTDAPKIIERAHKISRTDAFLTTLDNSVKTLTALGISATRKVSYYDTKTYVTICIDERE